MANTPRVSVILIVHLYCLYYFTHYAVLAGPASEEREIKHGAETTSKYGEFRFRFSGR